MISQYQFHLSVTCPDGQRHTRAFIVEAFSAPQFEPYDMCSEPLTAMMAGGVMPTGAARIDTDRKRLAEQIAAKITEGILNAIKGRDLNNGYPRTSNDPKL